MNLSSCLVDQEQATTKQNQATPRYMPWPKLKQRLRQTGNPTDRQQQEQARDQGK